MTWITNWSSLRKSKSEQENPRFLIELKDSKPAIGMTSLAPVQNQSSLVALSVAFRLAFLS